MAIDGQRVDPEKIHHPDLDHTQLPDPVAEVLRLMDAHGIATMLSHIDGEECRLRPDRFRGMFHVDPNQGMDAVRALGDDYYAERLAAADRLLSELRIIAPAIGRSICLEPARR